MLDDLLPPIGGCPISVTLCKDCRYLSSGGSEPSVNSEEYKEVKKKYPHVQNMLTKYRECSSFNVIFRIFNSMVKRFFGDKIQTVLNEDDYWDLRLLLSYAHFVRTGEKRKDIEGPENENDLDECIEWKRL